MCSMWSALAPLPPDAVLVGYGDAGVERVELHYGWNAGVSVDEYLIIQTGNACTGGKNKKIKNKKVENLIKNSKEKGARFLLKSSDLIFTFLYISERPPLDKKISNSSASGVNSALIQGLK